MFALPFNFPFRKSDGSLSTISDEINAGGGGGGYTLPTASVETKGGVKIGSGLTMEGEILNNSNPTPYTLPTASEETKGGVKIGSGLTMEGEALKNTIGEYSLSINLINVSESGLDGFRINDIATLGGIVELSSALSVGGNVQISNAGVPSTLRPADYYPMMVIATDSTASKFVPAIMVVYENGNIRIYNTISDIAIKYIWISTSYPIYTSQ